MNTARTTAPHPPEIRVWDPLVRIGHWLLVIAFSVAYHTADELETVHVWAGYTVGVIVLVRILWGVVGNHRARFTKFVRGPRAVGAYLVGLVRGGSRRYLGHNPAGAAMVVALLLALATTVGSGLALYAADEGEGPLAGWVAKRHATEEALEEVHEVAGNVTLALVFLHVAGVLASSLAHRENLIRSMVTGRKRTE
jgi:cytochrome b